MEKILKTDMKRWIKYKLSTDKIYAERALFRIYQLQTTEEKVKGITTDNNKIGFSGFDGQLLTNLVETISEKRKKVPGYKFSKKQFDSIIFRRIPKYWKQIIDISDKDKLKKAFCNDPINLQTTLDLV